MKELFFALAVLSIVFAGCLQEKTLDMASVNEPAATVETGAETTATPTTAPSGSGTATPAATITPTPTPVQSPPNCTIAANPESVTGPGDIILVVAFNRMPSDSSANVDCGPPGQSESVSVRANPNGAIGAFKRCTYPDVSSNTVFTARITATGGFSCSKEVTVRG